MNQVILKAILLSLLIGTLITAFKADPVEAYGKPVYNADTCEYFDMIQEAIDDCNTTDGHTIQVKAGYNRTEDLNISKSIHLEGMGRETTLINGTGTFNVINVTAPNVTISGFTIKGGSASTNAACIYANGTHGENLSVDNCTIVCRNIGIYGSSTNRLNITKNIITNGSYACIALIKTSATVTFNELTNGFYRTHGLDLNGSSDVLVAYNNISYNQYNGIYVSSLEGPYNVISIRDNYISHNQRGIAIDTLVTSGNAAIYDNTISDNVHALYHYRSQFSDPSPHKFYHNNFIRNTYNNITFQGSPEMHDWDDDYPTSGNYWDNHNGTDTKSGPYQNETGSDGIVDVNYTMGEYNTDRYPFENFVYVGPVNLTVRTKYLSTELYDVSVWIDNGDTLYSQVHVMVVRYQHEVKVAPWFIVWIDEWSYYKYTFDHWEDSSNSNPRNAWLCINKDFTAYYTRRLMGIGK